MRHLHWIAAALLLSACGLKGDLYLPEPAAKPAQPAAATPDEDAPGDRNASRAETAP